MKNYSQSKNVIQSNMQKRILAFTLKATCAIIALTVASQISIPLQPVPMTLQTTMLCLIALTSSPRTATAIVLTYLTLALMGLPILCGGACGPAVFIGPSAGYLAGFIVGTWITSFFAHRSHTLFGQFLACVAGITAICVIGALYLSTYIGIANAIKLGIQPFVLKEALSAIIATLVAHTYREHWRKK